jgi:transcription antitermination factor NusG
MIVETALFPPALFVGEAIRNLDRGVWWLLHTKSRQEKAVALQLHSRRLAFYLPLVPRRSMSRGKLREAQVPLFPSYVFLFGTAEDRLFALRTNRLASANAVASGEKLRRDLAQVAGLIAMGSPLTPEARLEPGQRVRVKSGPCAGYEGTLIKRHGKSRLVVRVEQLLQGASVEIEDYRLEAIWEKEFFSAAFGYDDAAS